MNAPSRKYIRNFCIIAHVDHGKSTLADRILEITGALSAREMSEQVLDQMELERERGITIKAQTVRLSYLARDGQTYTFHLIDTPGHVDFSYEVSRSLAACEAAVLVVDASQGVEAQTLANVYKALDANLEVIPVLNKIDLPGADAEGTRAEIEEVIGIEASTALSISAKEGKGVRRLVIVNAMRFAVWLQLDHRQFMELPIEDHQPPEHIDNNDVLAILRETAAFSREHLFEVTGQCVATINSAARVIFEKAGDVVVTQTLRVVRLAPIVGYGACRQVDTKEPVGKATHPQSAPLILIDHP